MMMVDSDNENKDDKGTSATFSCLTFSSFIFVPHLSMSPYSPSTLAIQPIQLYFSIVYGIPSNEWHPKPTGFLLSALNHRLTLFHALSTNFVVVFTPLFFVPILLQSTSKVGCNNSSHNSTRRASNSASSSSTTSSNPSTAQPNYPCSRPLF